MEQQAEVGLGVSCLQDREVLCSTYVFFLGVLQYNVMLQAFICYCSYVK